MELKDKYKNIKIKDVAKQGLERRLNITKEESTPELVERVNKMVDEIQQEKQDNIYIALHLLNQQLKDKNIQIKLRGSLRHSTTFILLMGDMPISEIICDDNINKKLIIEAEDVESVIAELNKICNNWGDTFIIEKDK